MCVVAASSIDAQNAAGQVPPDRLFVPPAHGRLAPNPSGTPRRAGRCARVYPACSTRDLGRERRDLLDNVLTAAGGAFNLDWLVRVAHQLFELVVTIGASVFVNGHFSLLEFGGNPFEACARLLGDRPEVWARQDA